MRCYQPLTHVYLYDEPDAPGLDLADISGYLLSVLPQVEVKPRADFFTYQFRRFSDQERALLEQEVLRQLEGASIPLELAYGSTGDADPVLGEDADVDFVFIAEKLQAIFRLLVDPQESGADHVHIILTNHGIGYLSEDTGVLRMNAICMGAPSIISLTGLVEALERPKEYAFRQAQMAMLGVPEEALETLAEQFADRTFGYADPRINEVCKGYALMACMYRMTGIAFCPDPTCRLHPARSQEQLIALQCGDGAKLCEDHAELLRGLG